MQAAMLHKSRVVLGCAGVMCAALLICVNSPAGQADEAKGETPPPAADPPAAEPPAAEPPTEEIERVTVEVARERAKLMHDIYGATLEVMHHRYFHRDKSTVPARAMEDIFDEIQRKSNVEARWISVNLNAMSIDHEPESEFEKRAAREIGAGQSGIEVVEAGFYRRAEPIPLTGGCVSCHAGFFNDATKSPKFAGLVISVPVRDAPGASP